MQRWFFLECRQQEAQATPTTSIETIKKEVSKTLKGCRHWTFNVSTHDRKMLPNEIVAVIGETHNLGNWQPRNCVIMQQQEDVNMWKALVTLPRGREIKYRYFIGAVDPCRNCVIIRRWETHLEPRFIPESEEVFESHDEFGIVDGTIRIDRGWLTTETIIQFKFFNAPFKWDRKFKEHLIYVKITPINLHKYFEDNDTHADNDGTGDHCLKSCNELPSLNFTEVCSLNSENCQIEMEQPIFGTPCGRNDLVIFHITVTQFDNVAYLIDLFTYSSKAHHSEPPYHLGYHYIMPNILKCSKGNLEVQITCATKHQPLGSMKIQYLLMKPLISYNLNMKISYQRYWNPKWSGLDVGHRGSGPTFKSNGVILHENTVASFKKAISSGADMIEFDVHLSKDLIPIVYHDFHVHCLLDCKQKRINIDDFFEIPVNALTLEQLKDFKIYHINENRIDDPFEKSNQQNEERLEDDQPFATLEYILDIIDRNIGFDIEVKFPQMKEDGKFQAKQIEDANLYVDQIIDIVLRKGCGRRIIFSCFDPDICALLRFKQNYYPVMFITQGESDMFPKYMDPRCNSFKHAMNTALAMELLGISAHTEDLLKNIAKIYIALYEGLIIFCWGIDNNNQEMIRFLRNNGVHGIIYDKMHDLTTKEIKESVFLVKDKPFHNELMKINQCLELERKCRKSQSDTIYVCDINTMLDLEAYRKECLLSTSTSIASLLDEHSD